MRILRKKTQYGLDSSSRKEQDQNDRDTYKIDHEAPSEGQFYLPRPIKLS